MLLPALSLKVKALMGIDLVEVAGCNALLGGTWVDFDDKRRKIREPKPGGSSRL